MPNVLTTDNVRYKTIDNRVNLGALAQWSFARVQASYARTNGHVQSSYMRGNADGNQFSIGASVPFAAEGALRLAARFAYGDYSFKGTRVTNDGTATFGAVDGTSSIFGGGLEYMKTSNKFSVDVSAELLSVLNKIGGFTETGAGALENLAVSGQRDRFTMAMGNIQLGYQFQPNFQGYMSLKLDHDFDSALRAVTARVSLEDVNMTVENPGIADTRVKLGLGTRVNLGRNILWSVEGNVGNASSYGAKTGISFRF